jgi:hypothetical protein
VKITDLRQRNFLSLETYVPLSMSEINKHLHDDQGSAVGKGSTEAGTASKCSPDASEEMFAAKIEKMVAAEAPDFLPSVRR